MKINTGKLFIAASLAFTLNVNAGDLAERSYEVQVKRGETVVFSGSLQTVAGRNAVLSSMSTHSYAASCDQQGSYSVGYKFIVMPVANNTQNLLTVDVEITDLNEIKHIKAENCTIDLPRLTGVTNQLTVALKEGEAFSDNNGRYDLSVRRVR